MRWFAFTGTDIFFTATTDATGKAYIDLFSEAQETLKVTVRGGNVIPFLESLNVVQPTGPYVIRETYTLMISQVVTETV